MISLTNIVKRYKMGEEEFKALDGVDLEIQRNEYVALIGPSGSGKSTLMNLLGCLDTPSEGKYVLNGRDTSTMDDNDLAKVRNQEIGFIFQSFHLLPRMTVLQNVMQPLVYRGIPKAERVKMASEALDKVGLSHRMGHRPNQLSGGQQQRVAIVRALMAQPALVLADEPTGNLDSQTADSIFNLLRQINQEDGTAFLIVTHDVHLASRCDRQLTLKDGALISDTYNPHSSSLPQGEGVPPVGELE